MSVLRDVVHAVLLSLICGGGTSVIEGCDAGKDVVLGDLAFGDAGLSQDTSAPDVSAEADGGSRTDTTLADMGIDTGPKPCPSGESVTPAASAFLADAIGFGRLATGGLNGCVYHVTSLADAGPGSLRDGAERPDPLWIVFDVSGDIELASAITMGPNKTIDGRGASITIRNLGFNLGATVSNVVIENVTFVGNMMGSNNDGIQIADGARTVWIDHCSLSNYGDGLIDITHAATDVTVSWCVFSMHNFVMLIGRSADDLEDVNIRVTLHHNWWNQTESYAPRLRFGKAHVLNNLIDRWRTAASACTMGGEIYSEANVFIAKDDKQALATSAGSDTVRGRSKSIGDLLQNGATVDQTEPDLVFDPSAFYRYPPAARADAALQSAIMTGAGAH